MNIALEPEMLTDGSFIQVARARIKIVVERDRRTMNNMDPETRAVHLRLERWGSETRTRLNGWPESTLLGRMVKQGPMGAPQQGCPPTDLSEPSARIDVCVAKLCQIDQRVLKTYYQHQLCREDLGRVMGMRERQAQRVLHRARWRCMAHLSVLEG